VDLSPGETLTTCCGICPMHRKARRQRIGRRAVSHSGVVWAPVPGPGRLTQGGTVALIT